MGCGVRSTRLTRIRWDGSILSLGSFFLRRRNSIITGRGLAARSVANKLKAMQQDLAADGGEGEEKKADTDEKSIYVGQVDYGATPEELQRHFQHCGGTCTRIHFICPPAPFFSSSPFSHFTSIIIDA